MDLNQVWEATLSEMEIHIPRAAFATWLKNSRLVDRKEGVFVIALPNNFAKAWVEDKYHKTILGIIRGLDDTAKKVEFIVAGHSLDLPIRKITAAELGKIENNIGLDLKVDPETNLNPRYTLKSFVVGGSNELAYAAACAVIDEIGRKYNPLFIYGGVGLGKTHLIQSIGNEIRQKHNNKVRPRYVSSEKFMSDIVWAIKNKRMEDIKKRYRDVDVLIIDDIQFIGGKEKTEEEFFHTFNALYETNKQIIISSDRPPQSIPILEERLRSRFEGGFVADVGYPEYEMRVAIIKGKLQEASRELDQKIIDLLANTVKRNVRELEGVLNKILFYQSSMNIEITEKVAEDIIEKSSKNFSRRVSDAQIIKAVSEFFNVPISELIGRGRKKDVVEPRQVAMFLLRDILEMSYPYIGEKMGRDHTTAIHAVDKINQEINKNSGLNHKINLIKELVFKG
jgi:chromosomal replication initiator protein